MYTKSYKAKILLFGEYTIINGSHALAMPISQYSGHWADFNNEQSISLLPDLTAFVDYLDNLDKTRNLDSDLDIQSFKYQIGKGLYFKSDIPFGYGAGSSGALCAAVFERFSKTTISISSNEDLPDLRKKLAQLEGFFHGSSSGIDPLVSLINKPILIHPNSNSIVQIPSEGNSKGAVFLLDTGIKRKTEPFVELFLKKRENEDFVRVCEDLSSLNENAINLFLDDQSKELLDIVHEISSLQLEHFIEMIPKNFIPIWKNGLNNNLYKLKLCGAGGGGFILGFTSDFEQTTHSISGEKLIPIYRF